MFNFWPEIEVFGSFLLAFVIAFVTIPAIITVVKEKNLYDEPNERASHTFRTPTLGGVGIFISIMIAIPLCSSSADWSLFRFLIAAMVIIFAIGIKDDILIISPLKKMLGQLAAASILVILADIRITNLHGFFNIHEISYFVSIPFSILVYIVIINAYNFIDGVDGLAASIGIINSLTFGTWFLLTQEYAWAVVAYSLAGGLAAFFWYNVYSVSFKIFMGDTGSLLVGLLLALFAIRFNEMNITESFRYSIQSAPSVTFAIMIVPLFDFFRVIFVRTVLERGIMNADQLHLHHRVLRLGLKHRYVTYWLASANIFFILLGFACQFISIRRLLLLELLLAMLLAYLPVYIYDRRKAKK